MQINGKVSIIMPAYNEAEVIGKNVIETIKTFHGFGVDFEIILIDDGSTDNTWDIIRDIAAQSFFIKATRNLKNFGKGRALKKGFRLAAGDYIVFLDSDIDLHPAQLSTFFDIMQFDDVDIVIGSKRHPNSVLNYPLQRRIISSVYFFLIKLMFGLPIRDTQTGLKLFKAEVLRRVFPKVLVRAFAFDLELLANANHLGYRIAEAPVRIDSQRQFSRIRLRDIIYTWIDTIAIFYRLYITKYYDSV